MPQLYSMLRCIRPQRSIVKNTALIHVPIQNVAKELVVCNSDDRYSENEDSKKQRRPYYIAGVSCLAALAASGIYSMLEMPKKPNYLLPGKTVLYMNKNNVTKQKVSLPSDYKVSIHTKQTLLPIEKEVKKLWEDKHILENCGPFNTNFDQSTVFFVIKEKETNRICAYASLITNEAVIYQVAVRADCRGKGLATQLVSMIENHMLYQHGKVVSLTVYDNNLNAQRLYESLGYNKISRLSYLLSVLRHRCDTSNNISIFGL